MENNNNLIYNIVQELNESNSTNHKIATLKKYKDNELLKRVLKMTYDKATYSFGVGKTTLQKLDNTLLFNETISLEQGLDILESKFVTREYTGLEAILKLQQLLSSMNQYDREIITKVIERDLRINIGKTQINKVYSNLITKPCYMRCDTYNDKTAKNINYPAILQLKADGTYREAIVTDGVVEFNSRSGESYQYPLLEKILSGFPDGVYFGELTVKGISDRAKANGLINSDNPPHEDIEYSLWDYVTLEEYNTAKQKDKKNPCKEEYETRFNFLKIIVVELGYNERVKLIPYCYVESLQEALQQTSIWMKQGFEGSILKDKSGLFKDSTSKHQLKLKLKISAEMRCVGFLDGTIGTKREGKVGSIIFENDELTIKGRCSGFDDDFLDELTNNPNKYIGKVMEVEFNDLSKAEDNDYYALSHPRFIEFRNDKNETDTLEKVFKLREMALCLS